MASKRTGSPTFHEEGKRLCSSSARDSSNDGHGTALENRETEISVREDEGIKDEVRASTENGEQNNNQLGLEGEPSGKEIGSLKGDANLGARVDEASGGIPSNIAGGNRENAVNNAGESSENNAKLAEKQVQGGNEILSSTGQRGGMKALRVFRTTVEAGVAEDKGSRHTMEDAWVMLHDARENSKAKLRCSHYAVYDGHGGRKAAMYAKAHLNSVVLASGLPQDELNPKVAKKAIIEGIKKLDEDLLKVSAAEGWLDGAAAVCVWILGQMVFVANLGDAMAVLARAPPPAQDSTPSVLAANEGSASKSQSVPLKGVVITRSHKAIFPSERARIEKAGGYVAKDGRLLGRVEVSRALGDRPFKKAGLSAVADVAAFELSQRERFLILGCDGLWGVFGTEDAVKFVEEQLKEGASAEVACRRLVREAIRERRCKDNCTAVLLVFTHQLK